MNGTPIYDVKPYVAYSDAHPQARSGFVDENKWQSLSVNIPQEYERFFSPQDFKALRQLLSLDPRPQYQDNPERVYGMPFAGYDVRFTVQGNQLNVVDVILL